MKFHSSKVLLPQYVIFLEYTLASVEANKTVLKEAEGGADSGVVSSTFTFVRISVLVFLALVIAVLITACLVGLFKQLCCLNSLVAGPNARNFPVQGAFRKVD